MERTRRLLDHYLPPGEGFVLESLVATTYEVNFEFVEEELLAAALGVRSPLSRVRAFRSELERKLQRTEVSVLFDLAACERLARLSPRIDAIPVSGRKLHSKISLLMWARENEPHGAPDRRIRLIVGSANLTRQGFRHNYECAVSLEFGDRSTSLRVLLTKAIDLVRQIGAESQAPQFQRQLAAFTVQANRLAEGTPAPDDPVALAAGDEVVATIRDTWAALSNKAPESAIVVSPFWAEGTTASEALFQLFEQLGSPANLELVCRGERSGDGKTWLPVFDSNIALDLKKRLTGRLFLRPTLPDAGLANSSPSTEESGDELEEKELAAKIAAENHNTTEAQRALHAKVILLDGSAGSVLYAGSSNCTRKGLGLPGVQPNFEAGFVYRLTPRQRKQINGLLEFAGPASEVHPDAAPATVQPPPEEECAAPSFLAEIDAAGTVVTIRFREPVPSDAVLLMPIPTKVGTAGFWLLYRAQSHGQPTDKTVTVDLALCQQCDERLEPLAGEPNSPPILPHVYVEVQWEGKSAKFPVRFDDKARLPLLLMGRKPTEGELIDYFLFGCEPDSGEDVRELLGDGLDGSSKADAPIDTRRILAYFIRRFVQAIPGVEAEVDRAAYSRASLDAALRGPTSPLELAERAYASLKGPPMRDEPTKTPTAVGFQLTELLAAIKRCRARVSEAELMGCFMPVEIRCREMLDALTNQFVELQSDAFRRYRGRILEDAS
jgi:hypothetical protein